MKVNNKYSKKLIYFNILNYNLIVIVIYITILFNEVLTNKIKDKANVKSNDSLKLKITKNTNNLKTKCPCALDIPDCCTPEYEEFECSCFQKPSCNQICQSSSQDINSSATLIHDSMLKLAMKDAYNQQDLAQKAKLQVDLFQKAQDFAKEVGLQEIKAKKYAKALNESTKKAQKSRLIMFSAANKARILAGKAINALSSDVNCGSNGINCPPSLIPHNYFNNVFSNFNKINEFDNQNIKTDYVNFNQDNLINNQNYNTDNMLEYNSYYNTYNKQNLLNYSFLDITNKKDKS